MFHDLLQITDEVLEKLPKQQQVVFRMSRLEGLNYDEIAEQLNISRNTVKNHLVQAVKNIRFHFDKKGILYVLFLNYFL